MTRESDHVPGDTGRSIGGACFEYDIVTGLRCRLPYGHTGEHNTALCATRLNGDNKIDGGVHGQAQRREHAGDYVQKSDSVNSPAHYTQHPAGVECIQITEHMNFNIGNAVKYLWRAGLKGAQLEDLQKARWYIDREIKRLEKP